MLISFIPLFISVIRVSVSFNQEPQPCPENPIVLTAGDYPQFIYSPYDERKNYPPNTDCRFLLMARNNMRRIHITIIESILEEPLFTDCEDYVSVRDGSQPTSDEIVRWCGADHPFSITGSGSSLYVHFHSDNLIQKRGFNISFIDYDLPGCPPEWKSDAENENCYKLFLLPHGATWIDAQRACNYEKSNLLTVVNGNEYTDVVKLFSQQHTFPWIGYNDAEHEGHFVSIEPELPVWPQNFPRFNDDHPTKDCVYMDWNIRDGIAYGIDDCRNRHSFMCKMSQDGSTVPVSPPTTLVRNGVKEAGVNNTIWLLILALIVLLLIILLIVYLQFKKHFSNRVSNLDMNQRLVGSQGSSVRTSKLEFQRQTVANTELNSGHVGGTGTTLTTKKEKKDRHTSAEKKKSKKQKKTKEQPIANHDYHTDSEQSGKFEMTSNQQMAVLSNAETNLQNLKAQTEKVPGKENAVQKPQETVIDMTDETADYYMNNPAVESDNPDDGEIIVRNEGNIVLSDDDDTENATQAVETSTDQMIKKPDKPDEQQEENTQTTVQAPVQAPVTTGMESLARPTFPHSIVIPKPQERQIGVETDTTIKMNEEVQTEAGEDRPRDATAMSILSDDFDGMQMPPMNPHTQKKQRRTHMHILSNVDAKTEEEFWED